MYIREIETKDDKHIEKIIKSSLESVKLNLPGTAYFDPHLGQLSSYYQAQTNAKYWVVANQHDEAVGGVGIGPFGEQHGVGELQKLYLAPEAQGKGLAKQLMKIALTFARENYTCCYLETFDALHAANQLYLKFGFVQLKEPLPGSDHNACDSWYIKKWDTMVSPD
ncbi:GNAT family N-acetyltransferase [Oceanobacillus sp. FSL H7-0719]|uniref:GNAT family N-acetyltransferase n=1 Tax=Oceanobacillus sp. FSL H7-0719 TaxID=2954507 RepID=UPI0032547683